MGKNYFISSRLLFQALVHIYLELRTKVLHHKILVKYCLFLFLFDLSNKMSLPIALGWLAASVTSYFFPFLGAQSGGRCHCPCPCWNWWGTRLLSWWFSPVPLFCALLISFWKGGVSRLIHSFCSVQVLLKLNFLFPYYSICNVLLIMFFLWILFAMAFEWWKMKLQFLFIRKQTQKYSWHTCVNFSKSKGVDRTNQFSASSVWNWIQVSLEIWNCVQSLKITLLVLLATRTLSS